MLVEFRKRHDRDPNFTKKSEDIQELKNISNEIIELYQFSNISVESLLDLLFGELAPVCAILGGIIAQEIIKAVSQKEVPLNNIFLFDPLTYSGKELTVGA